MDRNRTPSLLPPTPKNLLEVDDKSTIFFTSNGVTVGDVTAPVTRRAKVSDHRLSVDDRRDAAAHRSADVTHLIGVAHHADVIVDAGSVTDAVVVAASRTRHRAVQRIVTRERTLGLNEKELNRFKFRFSSLRFMFSGFQKCIPLIGVGALALAKGHGFEPMTFRTVLSLVPLGPVFLPQEPALFHA